MGMPIYKSQPSKSLFLPVHIRPSLVSPKSKQNGNSHVSSQRVLSSRQQHLIYARPIRQYPSPLKAQPCICHVACIATIPLHCSVTAAISRE
ncbi:hypothetical protein Agabi119p4_907 [Agaricus bisporus var. burnettii]|uniref:Uncharacterized protein n=1 Tax=Agaricus bisporus var. burnettii TaxID=192524 RepID=A0A8H7FBI2_AGABI|nr:hypothetical protein Agabi119p4_907 [Agaricus bisporus var. burnettii]